MLQFKRPYRDGTTHIVMSPLEFLQHMAALVPHPRLRLIRFHGVLAPHAKPPAAIVAPPAQQVTEHPGAHTSRYRAASPQAGRVGGRNRAPSGM